MKKSKPAFTMIELIFVIVILGILASVAVPKFGDSKELADIANARAQIASIRSGIVSERQTWLIKGISNYINVGEGNDMINGSARKQLNTGGLFGGVLMYPLPNKDSDGNWNTTNTTNGDFNYNIGGVKVNFDYDNISGKFDCNASAGTATQQKYCKSLTQ